MTNETKSVFALSERNEKTYWTRVGVAFENRDGSTTIQLDAMPVSGRLQIRERENGDRDEPKDRTRRR